MKVIVLGSGTGVPSLKRGSPAYWLGVGERQFLIDCGSGTLLQLERLHLSFRDLDGAFITHVHADHIGDLTPMVHAFRLPGLSREKPFTLYGPPGFTEFFWRIVAPVAAPPTAFPFEVQDVPCAWNLDGLTILTHPTPHSDRFASSAYRFEHHRQVIVFSGDTDWDEGLIPFCAMADLALLECSTLDENKVCGHLTPGLCGQLASRAKIQRLLLTHFYPIDGPDSRFLEQCRIHYSGPLQLAEDHLIVELDA
ncbi:MAG: ribonuclease Z [Magnetococcus sp. YQC-9]